MTHTMCEEENHYKLFIAASYTSVFDFNIILCTNWHFFILLEALKGHNMPVVLTDNFAHMPRGFAFLFQDKVSSPHSSKKKEKRCSLFLACRAVNQLKTGHVALMISFNFEVGIGHFQST